jgi:MFS family permease
MTDTATVTRSEARVLRRAGRRAARPAAAPGALLAIVLTGQFMAVLDASVVNVAAPSIHTDLHATGAALQLVIAGYVITYAVGLVTGARLGDIFGHRRMFLAGLALFTLASLGCGLAPSTGLLVGLRFVQGAGAAAMIPQVLSLIQRSYTGTARARAMRLYAAVIAGGAVAGQIAGGLLVTADVFGSTWRSVFLINVPIGAALLILGARWLPHGAADRDRGLDPAGLALLTPAVLALVLPLVLGQPEHWPAWGWACLAGSAVLFTVFTLVERRVAARGGAPLIPGRVLRLPGVTLGMAGLFVTMAVFGGFFFVLALHLQGGLGDSPLRAGLTFAVYWVLALTGAGMAAAFGPLMTAVLLRVPVAEAADATGVIVTVNQLALVVGVATFGTLYLNLAGTLPPGGTHAAFRLLSAHAATVTCLALVAAAVFGGVLAAIRATATRRAVQ